MPNVIIRSPQLFGQDQEQPIAINEAILSPFAYTLQKQIKFDPFLTDLENLGIDTKELQFSVTKEKITIIGQEQGIKGKKRITYDCKTEGTLTYKVANKILSLANQLVPNQQLSMESATTLSLVGRPVTPLLLDSPPQTTETAEKIQKLEKTVAELNQKLDEVLNRLPITDQKADQNVQAQQDYIASLTTRLSAADAALKSLVAEKTVLQQTILDHSDELHSGQERIKELEASIENLKGQIKDIEKALKNSEEDTQTANRKFREVNDELALVRQSAKDQNTAHLQTIAELQRTLTAKEQALSEALTQKEAALTEVETLTNELAQQRIREEKHLSTIDQQQENLSVAQADLSRLTALLKDRKSLLAAQQSQISELEMTISQLRQQLEEANTYLFQDRDAAHTAVTNLTVEKKKLSEKLNQAEQKFQADNSQLLQKIEELIQKLKHEEQALEEAKNKHVTTQQEQNDMISGLQKIIERLKQQLLAVNQELSEARTTQGSSSAKTELETKIANLNQSLKDQTEAVTIYQEHNTELQAQLKRQALDLNAYAEQPNQKVEELQAEIVRLSSELEIINKFPADQAELMQQRLNDLEQKLAEKTKELAQRTEELDKTVKIYERDNAKIEKMHEAQIDQLENEKAILKMKISDLEFEIDTLKKDLSTEVSRYHLAQKTHDRVQEEFNNLSELYKQRGKELTTSELNNKQLQAKSFTDRQTIAELSKQIIELQKKFDEARKELNVAKTEASDYHQLADKSSEQLNDWVELTESLQDELTLLQQHREESLQVTHRPIASTEDAGTQTQPFDDSFIPSVPSTPSSSPSSTFSTPSSKDEMTDDSFNSSINLTPIGSPTTSPVKQDVSGVIKGLKKAAEGKGSIQVKKGFESAMNVNKYLLGLNNLTPQSKIKTEDRYLKTSFAKMIGLISQMHNLRVKNYSKITNEIKLQPFFEFITMLDGWIKSSIDDANYDEELIKKLCHESFPVWAAQLQALIYALGLLKDDKQAQLEKTKLIKFRELAKNVLARVN